MKESLERKLEKGLKYLKLVDRVIGYSSFFGSGVVLTYLASKETYDLINVGNHPVRYLVTGATTFVGIVMTYNHVKALRNRYKLQDNGNKLSGKS